MSAESQVRRKTVKDIAAAKGGAPLVCLTAYDAPMARLLDPFADVLLVGNGQSCELLVVILYLKGCAISYKCAIRQTDTQDDFPGVYQ